MDGAYNALRGYKYQFDKTILELFKNPNSTIQIEQLQDLGVDDYQIQVKHHDTLYKPPQRKQKVKDPIVKQIGQFLTGSKNKMFVLAIYLRGEQPRTEKFDDADDIKNIIGNKTGFSNSELGDFVRAFTLIYCSDLATQYREVISSIKNAYADSNDEAEILYAIISAHLLDIVTRNPSNAKGNRTTSKMEIDLLIHEGRKLIFNSNYVKYLSDEIRFRFLNRRFFKSVLNREPLSRYFLFETENQQELHILKEIVLELKNKWGKNDSSRMPDSDRFVPVIYFRGLEADRLVQLKSELSADGYVINDGHHFEGSGFSVQRLLEKPTKMNNLQFKFVNSDSDFELAITSENGTRELYQFFVSNPFDFDFEFKQIRIEVKHLGEVKLII